MKRTDLAVENYEMANAQTRENGIIKKETEISGLHVISIQVTNSEGEKVLGKPVGTYITIETSNMGRGASENHEGILSAVSQEIRGLLNPHTDRGVIVIGLGNSNCTPDALGPKCASGILVTRHMVNELKEILGLKELLPVSSLSPGVLGQTGVETVDIVKGLVDKINPSAIIAIDALAARSIDRLGATVQIANTGINPGSGVGNRRLALNESSLGIPVIAVGVPTVVDAVTLTLDILDEENSGEERSELKEKMNESQKSMMVTPREIDVLIDHASSIISMSINMALHPELSEEDIKAMIG